MRLERLKQAPFNTTMMGVLRGALDYHGIPASDAFLFGASGHAFLINIHKELCPSGPYCWNHAPVLDLIANLGVRMTLLGFCDAAAAGGERARLEERVRALLDKGAPCSLVNMEHQLITGYDDAGFITAQPWPGCSEFPPARLTFGAWDELGDTFHVSFHSLTPVAPAQRSDAVQASLRYAVDLHRNPAAHTSVDYGAGPLAYANWVRAVEDGHGASHGNWWNAVVWAECRRHAAAYFEEIAGEYVAPDDAALLAREYRAIGDLLMRCSDRQASDHTKIELLDEAARRETDCIERIAVLC